MSNLKDAMVVTDDYCMTINTAEMELLELMKTFSPLTISRPCLNVSNFRAWSELKLTTKIRLVGDNLLTIKTLEV